MGVLIEHYGGAFPAWLAPVQARVLTIAEPHAEYARAVAENLKAQGFRAEADESTEKINAKVRDAALEKIPYLLVVGQREMEKGEVSVRRRDGANLGAMGTEAFIEMLKKEVAAKL